MTRNQRPTKTSGQSIAPHEATLGQVASKYGAFIVDVWGVICDGVQVFPSSVDALRRLRAIGPVALLSNTARRASGLARFLDELGIENGCYDVLVTAGEACHVALRTGCWMNARGRAETGLYYLGPERDRTLLADSGVQVNELMCDADAILCTGMSEGLTDMGSHHALLSEGVALGLPLVCANPDRFVRVGSTLMPCAGALADYYGKLGGRVIRFGKPEGAIYRDCLERLRRLKPSIEPMAVLAIGDGIETDILGANRYGISSLLVRTGIGSGHVPEKRAGSEIMDAWTRPDFVAPAFRW